MDREGGTSDANYQWKNDSWMRAPTSSSRSCLRTRRRVLVAPEDRAAIRILVVDDEPSILESCETVLGGEGYGCQVERRGEEALRRLKSETYDIVLIDQNMPQVHGLDILAELRKRNQDCLAVVMTGHATTEDGVTGHPGRRLGLSPEAVHGDAAPGPHRPSSVYADEGTEDRAALAA